MAPVWRCWGGLATTEESSAVQGFGGTTVAIDAAELARRAALGGWEGSNIADAPWRQSAHTPDITEAIASAKAMYATANKLNAPADDSSCGRNKRCAT